MITSREICKATILTIAASALNVTPVTTFITEPAVPDATIAAAEDVPFTADVTIVFSTTAFVAKDVPLATKVAPFAAEIAIDSATTALCKTCNGLYEGTRNEEKQTSTLLFSKVNLVRV